jgi:hypothetical protein
MCTGLWAQSGCIQGKVLDTKGEPIHSLSVVASNLGEGNRYEMEVQADSDGDFSMIGLPEGAYQVFTSDESKTNFGRRSLMTLDRSAAQEVEVAAGDSCVTITLRKPPRARVLLRATNVLTGEKIDSVKGSFRLSKDGLWTGYAEDSAMLVPPLTRLELQLGAQGYELAPVQEILPLQPGEVRELTVALRPVQLGCLAGRVVDQQGNSAPRHRIELSMHSENLVFNPESKLTNKSGKFKFEHLHPGAYSVFTQAELPFYVPGLGDFSTVVVPSGPGCTATTIRLGPKAAKLQFTVLDGVTHSPIGEANVTLSDSDDAGRGSWSLRALANPMPVPALRRFELWAGAKGYQTRAIEISPLQPEEVQKLTVYLQPEAKKP